jgi:hypothetical protein
MVEIAHTGEKPSVDKLHDVVDVLMIAIHKAFDGQVLDAGVLSSAFIFTGLGVMKAAHMSHIKERTIDFINDVDLDDIHPFDPSRH